MTLQEKVDRFLAGQPTCLLRTENWCTRETVEGVAQQPVHRVNASRDSGRINRRWFFNQNVWWAAFLGLYVDREDDLVGWMVFLITGLHASHLCHNSWCIDPFHLVRESRASNQERNNRVARRTCDCGSRRACMLGQGGIPLKTFIRLHDKKVTWISSGSHDPTLAE